MTRPLQIGTFPLLTATIDIGTAARPSLLDDADASYALATRAMVEDGDWAVLHVNGVAWLEKPPLHHFDRPLRKDEPTLESQLQAGAIW